jgi:hypothetical protein
MTEISAGTSRNWVLALAAIASFAVALDAMVLATALSRIQADLGASLHQLEWTVNGYNLSFAVLLTVGAALGERYGRKRIFLIGVSIFTLASISCALSPKVEFLIFARIAQGAGAACVMPMAMAMLGAAFPREVRGKALGKFGMITGLAVLSGPVVGGAIAEGLDWRWIFWINVPIGMTLVLIGSHKLWESRGDAVRIDVPGVILLAGTAFAITWTLIRSTELGWGQTGIAKPLEPGSNDQRTALGRLRETEPSVDDEQRTACRVNPSAMGDLGAQDLEAFAHKGCKASPPLGGHHGAIDIGLFRLNIDIGAARQQYLRFARTKGGNLFAAHHAIDGNQDLHPVTNGEDWFVGFVEMPHHGLDTLVGADVFRTPSARAVHRVIVIEIDLRKGLIDLGQMAETLDVGLVALEIMQRGLNPLALLLVRADDVDGVAHCLHPLLENEDLIFLSEFTAEHKDFLAAHNGPPVGLMGSPGTCPGEVESERRVREVELLGVLRRDQRRIQLEAAAHRRLAGELTCGHVDR